MKLYAFHSGGDMVDKAMADPFDPQVGTKAYVPWFFYLIVHPRGNVLFETGVHPSFQDDRRSRLGSWADVLDIRMGTDDDVVSKLQTVNITPTDVDIVVLSHLHFDHASALPLFEHARIVVQRAELAFARHPPIYQAGTYNAADFAQEHEWELLDGPHDLFGDGRIEIFPTPGHTPGHQAMLFRGDESRVILMGDATYSLAKMRERLLPAFLWNPDAMVASWRLIEWLETKEEAELLYMHDEEFASRVRLAPDEVYT